jgi:hypothetical protein
MYEVRHGDGVIRFEGDKIATVSAELPSKPRWTEFTVYRTTAGEWILEGVGRSRVPGESDRSWSVISDDPIDIVDAITGSDTSRLARRLLAESLARLAAPAGVT